MLFTLDYLVKWFYTLKLVYFSELDIVGTLEGSKVRNLYHFTK